MSGLLKRKTNGLLVHELAWSGAHLKGQWKCRRIDQLANEGGRGRGGGDEERWISIPVLIYEYGSGRLVPFSV